MHGKVSIILINYNGLKFNKECIDSILLQSYQNFEIVFVDNSSTDGSLEEIEKLYKKEIIEKKIIVVKNKENTGFTGGNNLGVKYANKKSEYICLLNNDTTVEKNRLKELIKGIESDPTLGAVSSIILDKGYEKEIRKTYFEDNEVFVLTVIGETAKQKISANEIKKGIFYTSSLSGCCFLYRKKLIEKPFPDFYFAYGEDVRLSLFLLIQGHKLAICSESIVNHFGSGSFGKNPSDLKLFYGNRNQIINFLVFYRKSTILKLLPLFIITQLSHIFINSSMKRIIAKLKALKWIVNNWSIIIKEREYVYKYKKVKEKDLIKLLSYKFTDNIFYGGFSGMKLKIINIFNEIFKYYCIVFFGK